MIRALCRPVEKMLHWVIGRDSGPFGRPCWPSGKNGRDRLPIDRMPKAVLPVSAFGSGKKLRTLPTKPFTSALGLAERSAAANGLDMKLAVRAFCTETSVPNTE